MAETGSFRSKLFGGFDRKDVADYIERLAAERNDSIVKTRDLEVKVEQLEGELETAKLDGTVALQSLKSEHSAEIGALRTDYEQKLSDANDEISRLKAELEKKRADEKDAAKEALDGTIERFSLCERDNLLLCTNMRDNLENAIKSLEALPAVLTSTRERIEEIREKLD